MNITKKIGITMIILIAIIITIYFVCINKNKKQTSIEDIQSEVGIRVKNIECLKGEEINVEIELQDDSNFVAANFEYIYDNSSLEYIGYEIGDSIANGAMTLVNNDELNSKVLIGFVANPADEKNIKMGKIINLKFRVKDNLNAESINNVFNCTTLKKEDGTDIKANITQGKIEVQ